MNVSNVAKGALAVALLASAPTQARAMEVVRGSDAAVHMNDNIVLSAYVHRGPAGGAHVHHGVRPGYHPGMHPGYHGGVYHGGSGYHGGVYRYGGWARPGWYHWGPGGAIAAGAAIGFLGAASVAAWAPPPPQPGLCWYYTDPSQRNGFWDLCP